ncbi:hypothetical protein ACT4UT_29180, partial [Bacillus sp. B-TM1]
KARQTNKMERPLLIHIYYECRHTTYWFAVPFIKLSIVLGFGSKVYDYIANNRKLVPVGHCREGICEIPTKK